MNLVKRTIATHPAYRAYNTMPTFFNSFFNDNSFKAPSWKSPAVSKRRSNVAAANIIENEDAFQIEMTAPGLGKEDISISLEDGRLTVSHKKEEEAETENEVQNQGPNFWSREFSTSEFSRSFRLSEEVINTSAIDASMEKGILTITLPKKEEAKPRPPKQIEIA